MISNLLFLFKKIKKKLLILLSLSFLIPILNVVISPIAIKLLINKGLANKNLTVVIYSILTLIISSILGVTLAYFLDIKMKETSNYFLQQFVPSAVNNYYKLDYSNVISKGEGYYLSRVYDEPRDIAEEFIPIVINTFKNCLTFIFGLTVAIYIAWQVTIILMLVAPLLYLLAKKYSRKIKAVVNIETEKEASLRNIISKNLQAFRTTVFYQLQDMIKEIVNVQLNKFREASLKSQKIMSLFSLFSSTFFATSQVIVIVLTSFAIFMGRLTIGGMVGYMNVYGRILGSVNSLSNNIPDFFKYQKYIERLQEIISIPEQKESTNHEIFQDILLENFCFKYNGTPIFEKADIHIKNKSNVLIEGGNGSGKTTLANILAGFLQIDEGINELPTQKFVGGLIEPYHFIPGTVKQNLNFPKLKKQKRNEILFFLERYDIKNKLDQNISELSYGQQKKLYIIMTMTSISDLYIYDEPLKGIDKESQEYVFNDIILHAKNSTFIMISHSDVEKKYFDQIIRF